jgi:hypothetical protein
MKILHGPANVGNQAWVLSRHERALGHESDLVVSHGTWLGYSADRVLSPDLAGNAWMSRLTRARFGVMAALKYDVIHYYFGQSYIHRPWRDSAVNFADLKLARKLGVKIFMTLQGCDLRRAGPSNARNSVTPCHDGGCELFSQCIHERDRVRTQLIEEILPLCDRVFYLNPEHGHDAPSAQFIPYASCDIANVCQVTVKARRRPVVLHAPPDRSIKGSDIIEAALSRLSDRFDFEYRAVRGVPHEEAMRLYQDADLVIDQVRAGWYGGFAVEVMAMGKPVVAYIRSEDLGFVPDAMRAELPILHVDPRRLEADLAQIFENRAQWADVGARSRAFVERWHDPAKIAAAFLRCYRDPHAAFEV